MTMLGWLQANSSNLFVGQRGRIASLARCTSFLLYLSSEYGLTIASGIKQHHLDAFRDALRGGGKAPSTINNYLSCVSVLLKAMLAAPMLRDLKMPFVDVPKQKKWHLRDDDRLKISQYLLRRYGQTGDRANLMEHYLDFVEETGLRVEEVLRLLPSDFTDLNGQRPGLNVPGTKTDGAAVWVPISDAAAQIARTRIAMIAAKFESLRSVPERRLFDISYKELHECWDGIREHLGVKDQPTSTLKALRRTFAARALRKGLSPAIIQELMRHASLSTTMGYLRLFGMSDNDETRALLNRQLGPTKYRALVQEADRSKLPEGFLQQFGEGVAAAHAADAREAYLNDFARFWKELYGEEMQPHHREIARAMLSGSKVGIIVLDDLEGPTK